MKLADRATIGNMAPEYGATMGFFPVDAETLDYYRRTGRTAAEVELVERYTKEQQLFRTDDGPEPKFTKVVTLDMGTVEPSLAGPKRPQDRVPLAAMKTSFRNSLTAPVSERGFALDDAGLKRKAEVSDNGCSATIGHGAVVIAAITSCTNTSNPSVMLAAGLLAKKAAEKGLKPKSYVKTSLAPGSRVVTDYFDKSGLTKALESVGFYTVGYGCTTCIGNSGPLPDPVAKAVTEGDLVASAVLSGNRNFEGRVNPLVKANYLASPPLVVAYALAGTTDIDLATEPLGKGKRRAGRLLEGHLAHVRRSAAGDRRMCHARNVRAAIRQRVHLERESGTRCQPARAICTSGRPTSTYIQEPPFLVGLKREADQDRSAQRGPRSGDAGRFGDDRPHFAGRIDRRQEPRRQVSGRARRRARAISTATAPGAATIA